MARTLVFKIDPRRPGKDIISRAARALRAGALVAFPTETVYGLGANILSDKAVRRLYKVKKRPLGKPFAILVPDISFIKKFGCKISPEARLLAGAFWPGPLTMVLPRSKGGPVGFRIPDNKITLRLIKEAGVPVAAPSANLSGRPAPIDAAGVLADLDGMIDILLDGGPTAVGVESTVVDMTKTPPKILREGAIKKDTLLEVLDE